MTSDRWRQVEDLFHAALRAAPPTSAPPFCATACPDDHALRREVESLLAQESGRTMIPERAGELRRRASAALDPAAH